MQNPGSADSQWLKNWEGQFLKTGIDLMKLKSDMRFFELQIKVLHMYHDWKLEYWCNQKIEKIKTISVFASAN